MKRLALGFLVGVALALPAAAFAGTQYDYDSGRLGVGGIFTTTGFTGRDYNQVWHQPGYRWVVIYYHTDGSYGTYADNSMNPTQDPSPDGYAQAECHNITDNSNVLWTCQTTH